MAKYTWEEATARDCVKRAKTKWGLGWAYLSKEQRDGAIALQVLSVISAQERQYADTLVKMQTIISIALGEENA